MDILSVYPHWTFVNSPEGLCLYDLTHGQVQGMTNAVFRKMGTIPDQKVWLRSLAWAWQSKSKFPLKNFSKTAMKIGWGAQHPTMCNKVWQHLWCNGPFNTVAAFILFLLLFLFPVFVLLSHLTKQKLIWSSNELGRITFSFLQSVSHFCPI